MTNAYSRFMVQTGVNVSQLFAVNSVILKKEEENDNKIGRKLSVVYEA